MKTTELLGRTMDTAEATIGSLRKTVEAAQEEFDMACRFHEAWKPTAYDLTLHERIGRSCPPIPSAWCG